MTAPIRLTYAEVVEAARKAYLEGRLSAQGPTPSCKYRDNSGRPCVVGAALDDAIAVRADTIGDVWALKETANVSVSDYACDRIGALQFQHDEWCRARVCRDPDRAEIAHGRLRKLLNIEEPA